MKVLVHLCGAVEAPVSALQSNWEHPMNYDADFSAFAAAAADALAGAVAAAVVVSVVDAT